MRAQVEEIIGHGGQAPTGHIPFTPRAKKVLELSLREALQLGHNYIGTEHILLGLIREGEGVAAQVLVDLGADLARVRQEVIQLLAGYAGSSLVAELATMSTPPGRARTLRGDPQCSVCGRDLWEVSHYVDAGRVFICDVCITSAHAALEAAGADERVLGLPPRVFGSPPEDDPDAVDEVIGVLKAVFGPAVTDETAAYLEDGAELVPILQAAAERYPGARIAEVSAARVRFSGETASVAFELVLTTGGRLSFVGTLTRADGRWIVTRQTIADVLGPGGIALP